MKSKFEVLQQAGYGEGSVEGSVPRPVVKTRTEREPSLLIIRLICTTYNVSRFNDYRTPIWAYELKITCFLNKNVPDLIGYGIV